jgi:hypothetical protein
MAVGGAKLPDCYSCSAKIRTREHSLAELDTTETDVQLARGRAHLGDIPSDRRRRGWRADSARTMRPRRDDFDGWYTEHSLSSEGGGSRSTRGPGDLGARGPGDLGARGPGDLGARWLGIQATVQVIGESCSRSRCGEPQPHCDGNGRPRLYACHDPDLSPSTPEARRRLERRTMGARIALRLVVRQRLSTISAECVRSSAASSNSPAPGPRRSRATSREGRATARFSRRRTS